MATTTSVSILNTESEGSQKKVVSTIAVSGTYDQTDGIEVTADSLGLAAFEDVVVPAIYSSYVWKGTVSADKQTCVLRAYDTVDVPGGNLSFNVTSVMSADATVLLYYEPVMGTFEVGEVVTGGISMATGTVVAVEADPYGNQRLVIGAPSSGAMVFGETITGGTSMATGTTLDEYHNTFDIDGSLAVMTICEGDNGSYSPLSVSNSYAALIQSTFYKYNLDDGYVETILSDAYTAVRVAGINLGSGVSTTLPEVETGFAISGVTALSFTASGY